MVPCFFLSQTQLLGVAGNQKALFGAPMNAVRPWSGSPSAVRARGKVQSGRGKAKAHTTGEMSVLSLFLVQWPSAWAKARLQHPRCCLCCSHALVFLCFQLLLTNGGRESSRLAPGSSSLPAPVLSWCNLSLTCAYAEVYPQPSSSL